MSEKNKGGRPNKYLTDVKPRFAEITEWLNAGATDKEIADNLGINKATICDYKKKYSEFNELLINGRKKAVQAIKAALYKRATGLYYSEKKVVRKQILLKDDNEEDIPATLVQTEEYTKYALPDPASAMILLKHWAKDEGWTNDPASLDLKKQEFEWKKENKESEEW